MTHLYVSVQFLTFPLEQWQAKEKKKKVTDDATGFILILFPPQAFFVDI